MRAGKGLVTKRTGLHVRGEILVELPAVRTHSFVRLDGRTTGLAPGHLRLGLLGPVQVGVIVPDVAAQGVVGLELLLTVLADVGQMLVVLLEVLVELPTAPADLPVVVLELVALEELGLEEDLAADGASVLGASGLSVVLEDPAGSDGDPVRVDGLDVPQQLLLAAVSLLRDEYREGATG